ncbi:hypothetical protein R3W88_033055 [Solanum pinnatisectum]|uniref:RNase H type-1 domain-containing protein n=1 Tax=Solanum pinnatisectum TaxID=50273 RepID=A0AAV9K211_9SOLN|nr:hypothetical protein R3W88_033055 [Solanum pinnatisectum]
MRNKQTNHIPWKIRSGSSSFWWDNWLRVGPLAHFTTNSNRFNNDKVTDFMEDGQWNTRKVSQLAPHEQVQKILSFQIQLQQGQQDQAVWTLNSNGIFSVSSTWNIIREAREKTKFNTYTWHKSIPFKCSFLLWRTIRGKLLTNEKLANFGIGAGGIIRNQNGELILAFSTPLGQGTNNQAEVEAAILGLSWCANLRYKNVIL